MRAKYQLEAVFIIKQLLTEWNRGVGCRESGRYRFLKKSNPGQGKTEEKVTPPLTLDFPRLLFMNETTHRETCHALTPEGLSTGDLEQNVRRACSSGR